MCIFWRPADINECRFGYHCRRRASDCCNLQRGSRNKLISPIKDMDGSYIGPMVTWSVVTDKIKKKMSKEIQLHE